MVSLTDEITIHFSTLAKKPQIVKVKTNVKERCSNFIKFLFFHEMIALSKL